MLFGVLWSRPRVPNDCYHLIAWLPDQKGPINCLAFTCDGGFLANGGDDQVVQIWDTKMLRSRQVLLDHGEQWGQITCLKWISSDAGDPASSLCFGTGRGMILIYRRNKTGTQLLEQSNTKVFPNGDSVEALAYDPGHGRLATTSHYGLIRMYTIEKNGTLVKLWGAEMDSTIPRAVHFMDSYQSLLILGLETGEMSYRDAETSAIKSLKVLKSGVGSADVCSNEKYLLVHNLSTGFELYNIPRTSPTRTFAVSTTRRYAKQGVFAENSAFVVCGSDHGKVYMFRTSSSECVQTLRHTKGNALIQSLDSITTPDRHLIASGSSESGCNICIWEKPIKQLSSTDARDERRWPTFVGYLNGLVLCLILCYTMEIWACFLLEGTRSAITALKETAKLTNHWVISRSDGNGDWRKDLAIWKKELEASKVDKARLETAFHRMEESLQELD